MLKPSVNLKLGLPMLIVVFVVSALALYGGARLVKQDEVANASGGGGAVGAGVGPTIATVVAENLSFNVQTITSAVETEVTITLDNQDAGVLHNIAFYTDRSASQLIAGGELFAGVGSETISFTAPAAPGTYFFKCDAHPDQMNGAFVVQ